MGNSVSSSARLAGINNLVGELGQDVQYEKSIGSSRFLKAIRARHSNGPLVVKLFIKPDPGMTLRNLVRRLRVEREALSEVPNILTHHKVIETDRAGYLIRQWLSNNLYDRISTRPFLTVYEKKWIAFQLLCAMRDARERKIAHGDLKCENVLVTTSNFVYITDFASAFKPTYLPLDDPADFSFFFDTSGRRTCYIAPERFYEHDSEIGIRKAQEKAEADARAATGYYAAAGGGAGAPAAGSSSQDAAEEFLGLGKRDGKVSEAMDVFSLGCVIAELFRDGTPMFTLSQLYKYRDGEYDPEGALAEIEDAHVRSMVRSMISLDPTSRLPFEGYLSTYRGTAFPDIFYTFLHDYVVSINRTCSPLSLSPPVHPQQQPSVSSHYPSSASLSTAAAAPSQAGTISTATATAGVGTGVGTMGTTSGGSTLGPSAPSMAGGEPVAGTVLSTDADERIERLWEEWVGVVGWLDKERAGAGVDERTDRRESSKASVKGWEKGTGKEMDKDAFSVQLFIPGLEDCSLLSASKVVHEEGASLVLLSLLLSNLRNCLRPSSKLHALDLLLHLSATGLSDETKLDRVVPYVVALFEDESANVRAASVKTVTQILLLVNAITPSNAAIFPEYILPNVRHFTNDPEASVRAAYASCIVPLAETGQRYLEMGQAMKAEGMFRTDTYGDGLLAEFMEGSPYEASYDAGLQDLQSSIQDQVTTLLTDPSSSVKRALLQSITPLCIFFGRTKTNDVLLSHMITFLNDRDWLLREAFFVSIVGVATCVGAKSLEEYILPLMLQALSDTEEFVVARVINGLTSLTELGLFPKARLWDLLGSVIGFLCHPNVWIRQSAAGFVSAASRQLPETDVWCVLYPSLRPLLKADVSTITELSLLDMLQSPLPRSIFDAAVSWAARANKTLFWKTPKDARGRPGLSNGLYKEGVHLLAGKKTAATSRGISPRSDEDDGHLDRLRAMGMTASDEIKLAAMREYILKLGRGKNVNSRTEPESALATTTPVELQNLEGVTPQTIFFSSRTVPEPNGPMMDPYSPARPSSLRSQTTESFVRRSGSAANLQRLSLQDAHARAPRKFSDASTTASASPLEELRRRMESPSVASGGTPSLPPSSTMPPMLENLPPTPPVASSSGAATPDALSTLPFIPASPSRCSTPAMGHSKGHAGRQLISKAAPAVGSSFTTATGTMDITAKFDDVRSGRSTPASTLRGRLGLGAETGVEAQGPRFTSTYDGNDPNVRSHLEDVYLRLFREPIPEFGPRVANGPPRRRASARSSLASRERLSGSVGGTGSARKPEGSLVAYFTEHAGGVTSLVVSPDHLFFVSGSEDGSVKVWDTTRLEKNVTSRSRATYAAQRGPITALAMVENSHCVASASEDGSLHVFKVEVTPGGNLPRYGKLPLVRNFQISQPGEWATCMAQWNTDTTSNLLLGTTASRIIRLDLRTMQIQTSFQNPVHHGPISCLCVDRRHVWLLVGTTGGTVSLWDLRFGLRLRSWKVGAGEEPEAGARTVRVNAIKVHPSKGRGRWVMIACERLAEPTPRARAAAAGDAVAARGDEEEAAEDLSSSTDSPSPFIEERTHIKRRQRRTAEADEGRRRGASNEVLVEVWDIDKVERVETFEVGAFPPSGSPEGEEASTSASASASGDGAGKSKTGTTTGAPSRSSARSEEEEEEDKLDDAAGAIARLVREREAAGRANGTKTGAKWSAADGQEDGGGLTSQRGDVKAIVVGLEGYGSAYSALGATSGAVPGSGGWLDAGRLAADAGSGGGGGGGGASSGGGAHAGGAGAGAGAAGFMLCAGEDRCVRFWDLGRCERSTVVGAGRDSEKGEFRSFPSSPARSTAARHIHRQPRTSGSSTWSTGGGGGAAASAGGGRPSTSSLMATQQQQLLRCPIDAVTALAVIEHPFRCVVAGERRGGVRVWE